MEKKRSGSAVQLFRVYWPNGKKRLRFISYSFFLCFRKIIISCCAIFLHSPFVFFFSHLILSFDFSLSFSHRVCCILGITECEFEKQSHLKHTWWNWRDDIIAVECYSFFFHFSLALVSLIGIHTNVLIWNSVMLVRLLRTFSSNGNIIIKTKKKNEKHF